MAKTQKIDPAAAKARKQKIMLGVIGAVLVVIAVIQVPKLMSAGSTPAAAAGRHDGRRHHACYGDARLRLRRRRRSPEPRRRPLATRRRAS